MNQPKLTFVEATLHHCDTHTRMPFRFGIAVMTEATHVILRCRFLVDGRPFSGLAADGLLPKWFEKNPQKPTEQEMAELFLVIRQAADFAHTLPAANAFSFWRQLYDLQLPWAIRQGIPALAAHFGVSMVERAMLDALARSRETNLSSLLRANLPGLDLASIHPELAGGSPDHFLPRQPLDRIIARHTVGLTDPLTAADLEPGEPDGLPRTLEDSIRCYGLHHFKLKVRGDLEADLARLEQIAEIVTACCSRDYAFTLDGNEQFRREEDFSTFWEQIQASERLRPFFRRLLFVEQPFHRDVALQMEIAKGGQRGPRIIIDESDAEIGDLARALELGYAGTSHKNCKGVLKGVAHRCLINHRNLADTNAGLIMSGEDLVNIGPVALLQDLAAQAALGNHTVERNGHHYFRGLTSFPPAVAQAVLACHPDLYLPFGDSARLDIRDGLLHLDTINRAPFGVLADPPLDGFEALRL